MIKFAKLPIAYHLIATKKELAQFNLNWFPHLNTMCYEGDWTVLALRSPGGRIDAVYADSIHEEAFIDTPLMDQFPSIKKMLNELASNTMSVRFLKLGAGSIIKKHRDNELAFENGLARVHFPIVTNPFVAFYLEEELIEMQEGEAWYINANLPHNVANFGTSERIHLVIDLEVNDWVKELFNRGENKIIEPLIDIEQMHKIINQLRIQNTKTSLDLANKLSDQLINNQVK